MKTPPWRKGRLLKAIAEIENQYPADDLITSYSDFIKVRDCLRFYQFNPTVLFSLLKLVNEEWSTEKRINRLSLVMGVKHYVQVAYQETSTKAKGAHLANNLFSLETRKLMFELFRKSYEENDYISHKQLDEIRMHCNSILLNVELTPTEEDWLCNRAFESENITNRILRYPVKSPVISRWVKANFLNPILSSRRAEMLGWILDEDPHYEIDEQTLLDDFENMNEIDMRAIKAYDEEIAANKILENEIAEFLPRRKLYSETFEELSFEESVEIPKPELKLFTRFYGIPLSSKSAEHYPVSIPDFERMSKQFKDELPIMHRLTMIWGVAYSRLDNDIKLELFQKYYSLDVLNSLYKIGKRLKDVQLLNWLLGQQ